jgi:hypothetical protein
MEPIPGERPDVFSPILGLLDEAARLDARLEREGGRVGAEDAFVEQFRLRLAIHENLVDMARMLGLRTTGSTKQLRAAIKAAVKKLEAAVR